ncbi:hypothetical protein LMG32879_003116 [Brytella acorum]|uniref:Transposase IS4-like domain-containing protein n=2 Tax=Brytella acorum TaxID=2959299 RepID=A0AA35UZ40_9PROT|nr:transposase [Brytella acorum]CAI9122256.1 hypothetical protein LMG32879_003116 [Brytella acorum]
MAVDTLGYLLALHGTPTNREDHTEVGCLAAAIQEVTDGSVELAYVDEGYTGSKPDEAVRPHGIALEVVKLPQAKCGFVLLPRRWVAERSFAWPHGVAGSSRITSVTRQRSQVFMSSHSHVSCSEMPLYSLTVHNAL